MRVSVPLALAGAALLPLAVLAAPAIARADAVDDAARVEMKRRGIPGLSVVVYKGDKLVKRAAYGEADLESHVAASPDGLYETGSICKSLTAVLTMMLVADGKLSLDDPVSKHFAAAPAAWEKITLRHLLTHTSGLPDYATVPGLGLVERWTLDDWTRKIVTLPLDFPTGTQFAYSNTNYFLLGLILEKAGGKPYAEMLTERVLKPAGMAHTRFEDPREIIPGRARGYYRLPPSEPGKPGLLINAPEMNQGGTGADGGLLGTADDLAAYERALRTGKLLPPETVKLLQTAQRLPDRRRSGYGMGWFVRDLFGQAGRPWLSHGGNTAGYAASVSRFPSEDLTVALACNVGTVGGDELALKLAQAVAPSLAPPKYAEHPDPDPARTAKIKAALNALGRGETSGDALDPAFAARLSTGRGRMGLAGLAPLAGVETLAFLQADPADPESGDVLVRYRVLPKGAPAPLVVGVVVTREGRIFSVSLRPEA
jgi:CubicO group peptidase (beta-lactamase class C family)